MHGLSHYSEGSGASTFSRAQIIFTNFFRYNFYLIVVTTKGSRSWQKKSWLKYIFVIVSFWFLLFTKFFSPYTDQNNIDF